jgi:hypothetical protein
MLFLGDSTRVEARFSLFGDSANPDAVEARFSLFGDSANPDARWVHGLRRTYHCLGNCFGHIQWTF